MLMGLLTAVFFVFFFGFVFTADIYVKPKIGEDVKLSTELPPRSPPPSISLSVKKSALSDLLVNSPPTTPKADTEIDCKTIQKLQIPPHVSVHLGENSDIVNGPVYFHSSSIRGKSPIARDDFLQTFLKKSPSVSEPEKEKAQSDDESVEEGSDSDEEGVFKMDD